MGSRRRVFRWRYLLIGLPVMLAGLILVLVLSFRMGGEARVMKEVVMEALPNEWERQVEIGVGEIPSFLVRTGLRWVDLDPVARAGLQAFRSADVGVYRRVASADAVAERTADLLGKLLERMGRRGWEPVVTVREGRELVAVLVPVGLDSARRLKVCVLVLDGDDLVVVSARGNLEPLIEMGLATAERFGRKMESDRTTALGGGPPAPSFLSRI